MVMVHPPTHPLRSRAGWLAYHHAIAGTVPELGVVLYLRDPAIGLAEIAELLESCPNVIGAKCALSDCVALADLVAAIGGRAVWSCGLAESWAPFHWQAGARGFTSGVANVDPRPTPAMLDALRGGDDLGVLAAWRAIRPFEELRGHDGGALSVATVKEAMVRRGLLARASIRAPLSGLPAERAEALDALADLCVS